MEISIETGEKAIELGDEGVLDPICNNLGIDIQGWCVFLPMRFV